ncbi:MAG: glycosyltransferase family 2 protein [Eubacteriales bacterium]
MELTKENNPKISVIMGINNCEATLAQSIESIIYQTYLNWELILCDDGSKDRTYEIAAEYVKKDNRIRLLKNDKNIKLGPTLNRCLEFADGEYTARMDGDDISEPERFEKQVDFLENNKEYAVVGCLMRIMDGNGIGRIRVISQEPDITWLPKNNPCFHATIIMKTCVYKEIGGYSVSPKTERAEDFDLFWRLYEKGYSAFNLQEPLYIMREPKNAYNRRKFKYSLNVSRLVFIGCRKMHLPAKHYIYILKPLISGILPRIIMYKYHYNHDKSSI